MRSTNRSCARRTVLQAAAILVAATALQAPAQQPAPAPSAPPFVPSPPIARFVVVLDAAHGGDDTGARIDNGSEKDIALALSVKLRSLLAARGFQVITTRESDATLDATRRAEIANRLGAQACLSLHATESGSGIHLFASSLMPAAPTRIPAWKTAQGGFVTRSLALAGIVNSALLHAGFPVTVGRTALPGVDSMTCPAIAVEIAPLHPANAAITSPADPAYQGQIAEALAAALLEWKTEARQP